MRAAIRKRIRSDFVYFFIATFNTYYLLSMVLLALFSKVIESHFQEDEKSVLLFVILPTVNSLMTMGTVVLLNFLLDKRVETFHYIHKKYSFVVAFIAGFLPIYIAEIPELTAFLIIGVFYIAYKNISFFFKEHFSRMMNPQAVLSKDELFHFCMFLCSLVTTYIVINLCIDAMHVYMGFGKAFNFSDGAEGILDSLYFTFVIVTTVGLGDIVPLSPLAKIVVAMECLSSYFILAFVIGIINRGIIKK